jgi:hypothetical protein
MLFVLGGKDYDTKEPVILVDGRLRLRFGGELPLVDIQEITISDSEDEDIQELPPKRARTEPTSTGRRPTNADAGDDERENASGKGRSSSGDTGKGSSGGESPSYTPKPPSGRGRGRFYERTEEGAGGPPRSNGEAGTSSAGPSASSSAPPPRTEGSSKTNEGASSSQSR